MNRYPWPASGVGNDEMAILHAVRESSRPRVPISELIKQAIRKTYGQVQTAQPEPQPEERQAA
jgi:hypothetical protein